VFAALATGFDRVAANPLLILPTLLLDLFLWFGPRLSIAPLIPQDLSWMGVTSTSDPTANEQIAAIELIYNEVRLRLNLMSGLSVVPQGMPFNLRFGTASLPIGVPSLMSYRLPISNPFGSAFTVAMEDPTLALLTWLALIICGAGLGTILHRKLVQQVAPNEVLSSWWLTWGRMILLSLIAYGVGLLFATLSLIVSGFLWQFGDILGFALLIFSFSVFFWIAVYLVFTAHGIVSYNFGLLRAMRESVYLARTNMLSTIGFLFLAFGISWAGVDFVWSIPAENSWLMLLALIGYAFVSATLLTASYVFYRGRRTWLEQVKAAIALHTPAEEDLQDSIT
jgi:hypothetical protein